MEIFLTENNNLLSKLQVIEQLIDLGTKHTEIINAAKECRKAHIPERCAFEFAFNKAVFRASPFDRQQFRTVNNILRTGNANCTGYVTVIGSILRLLNIPFEFVVAGSSSESVDHIYLKSRNYILDCVIGQNEDGTESFDNRNRISSFNVEFKKNFRRVIPVNMITVLNGNKLALKRTNLYYPNRINGIFSTAIELLGDPCKRDCDIKHPFNKDKRQECKSLCPESTVGEPTGGGGYYQQPQQNQFMQYLPWIAVGVGAYLVLKK